MIPLINEAQEQVEEYSSLFFTAYEIAVIMQLDLSVFTEDRLKEDDFNLPFLRGRLKKEAELRKSIINLAVNGSSPAQILATQIIATAELKNISI